MGNIIKEYHVSEKIIRQALFLYNLFDNRDFEEKLYAASSCLSDKKRGILHMYYIENRSVEYIAKCLHTEPGKIRFILRESLKTIRQSPNKRYFEYGVALTKAIERVNDKIQDNAAMLIWLNQTEYILDSISDEGNTRIEDFGILDILKERLLGAKYQMVKDISSLDVRREIERVGRVLLTMPVYNQIPIEELGFTARTYNCLHRAGCHTLEDVCNLSKSSLIKIRNMGTKSVQEVINVAEKYGYILRD